MPRMRPMAGLMVALGAVACAAAAPAPAPAPLPQQAAISLPIDPPAQSCEDPLPRSMESQPAASEAPRCLPRSKGFYILEPHLFGSHDDFGHAAEAPAFGPALPAPSSAGNRRPPTPPAVQRCGIRMLSKTAVPYCVAP